MLKSFRFSNYASFKDTAELSMTAAGIGMNGERAQDANSPRILRASALYGANASGKSNLIDAMRAMRGLVVYDKPIDSNRWFRPDPAMADEPSLFEAEIELGGTVYTYGFEYLISRQEVMSEWLRRIRSDGTADDVFIRADDAVEHRFSGRDKQIVDIYAEDILMNDRILFLGDMGRIRRSPESLLMVFNDIYGWFDRSLFFVDPQFPFSPDVIVPEAGFRDLDRMIASFGTGVSHVAYKRVKGLGDSLPGALSEQLRTDLGPASSPPPQEIEGNRYASVSGYRASIEDGRIVMDKPMYCHGSDAASYSSGEESDGAVKLYGLLAQLFLRRDGSTFLIDDLDAGLHPLAIRRLVKLFLDSEGRSGSQIVFATDETSLLDSGLLGREEAWCVEKGDDGRSRLHRLDGPAAL